VKSEDIRASGTAALATLLGACALVPVFTSAAWLPPVLAVVLTVLAGGLLLRVGGPALWARMAPGRPAPERLAAVGVALVPIGQLVLLGCVLTALYAPAEAVAKAFPTGASLEQLGAVLADGSAEVREQATPALPLTGLLALTAVFVGLVAVIVDLVAVAGRQAVLAGLGLLVLYCVPVVTITGGIGLIPIVAPATGLALLLWTDQHRRLSSSGRRRRATGTLTAFRIGLVALLAALTLGSVVPTLTEGSFATGLGGGSGGSTGTALDPVAALQGQLTLPEPVDLLRMESSVEDPGYLRAVAIDEYDNEAGWTIGNLRGETSIADDDRLAPLPDRLYGRPVSATIRVLQHDDRFLPSPFSPLSIRMADEDADGWRFDPDTGTVYGRGVTSGGRSYTVTASEPRPASTQLADAEPLDPGSQVQQRFTALPPLDPRVTDLVTEATEGAAGPYERVRSIQNFLTDRANGFVYSLSTAPGTSGDDLVDFLRLRRGYCEQYAGAMAVMVRAAGVPARVALGYTPGVEESDGSRLITSDDAHAWVEAYFENLGWVPFDPTPISADRAVDLPWAPRAGLESSTDERQDVPVPSLPTQPVPSAPQDRGGGGLPATSSGGDDAGLLWPLAGGVALALLAAAVVAAPAGIRILQRRRRIGAGNPGALWDELTATALDLGVRLHPAWTPRRSAAELAARMSPSGEAGGAGGAAGAVAVRRLAMAEESASYGPARGSSRPVADADLTAALQAARRQLMAAAPRSDRVRARWWPASLVDGAGTRLAAAAGQRLSALGRFRRERRTRTV
jgi:transglutaminase-like putative cysteine protease